MKKGFNRVFIVVSIIWVFVGSYIIIEPVLNQIYDIHQYKKADRIKSVVESSPVSNLGYREIINYLKKQDYENIDILYYLYLFRDFEYARVESENLYNLHNDYFEKSKIYDYYGLHQAYFPTSYFTEARYASWSGIFFKIFLTIISPLIALWLALRVIAWTIRGFID